MSVFKLLFLSFKLTFCDAGARTPPTTFSPSSCSLLAPDHQEHWKQTQKQEEGGHISSHSQPFPVFLATSFYTVIPAMCPSNKGNVFIAAIN